MPTLYQPRSGYAFFDATESDAPSEAVGAAEQPATRMGRLRRRATTLHVLVVASIAVIGIAVPMTIASADPSPTDWSRLRMCEASGNYQINTGNGYYGAYQFNLSTWKSVGGTGYPNQATPAEQDARALKLYRQRGWQPWTCATILGLKSDKDAKSGRVSDIVFPTAGVTPDTPAAPTTAKAGVTAPAWPGLRYFSAGDSSSTIAKFQSQLHARGAVTLTGTGQFGANTLTAVKRIQSLNGLAQTGILGPVTWKLAWTGKY
jgi:peptidoglycan hydrolase-like protein with peptidoglycan-binding domain